MDERRILLVANQTAGGDHLLHEVRRKMSAGPCSFTLLVPASAPDKHTTYTEGEAIALAERRLHTALTKLRAAGAEVEGVIGDEDPYTAIGDVLLETPHDEIILSTLPPGISRWLKADLPHRVARRYNLPVTTITATPRVHA
jgi:hypothetical protein